MTGYFEAKIGLAATSFDLPGLGIVGFETCIGR
jgi:hypothetical protein